MSDAESLLQRARAYAEAHKLELTTVSKRLFSDWRRLDAVASGSSFLRPPTLKAALERMSALDGQQLPESSKGASNGEENQRPARSGV